MPDDLKTIHEVARRATSDGQTLMGLISRRPPARSSEPQIEWEEQVRIAAQHLQNAASILNRLTYRPKR